MDWVGGCRVGLWKLEYLLSVLDCLSIWRKHSYAPMLVVFLSELECRIVACRRADFAWSNVCTYTIWTALGDNYRTILDVGVTATHCVSSFLNRRHVAWFVPTAKRSHSWHLWLSSDWRAINLEVWVSCSRPSHCILVNLHPGCMLIDAESFFYLRRTQKLYKAQCYLPDLRYVVCFAASVSIPVLPSRPD